MCLYKIIINYSLYNFNDKNKKTNKKTKEEKYSEDKNMFLNNLKMEHYSMLNKNNTHINKSEKVFNTNEKRINVTVGTSNYNLSNNIKLPQTHMENVRYVSTEKQHNIIKICIDTLYFFQRI